MTKGVNVIFFDIFTKIFKTKYENIVDKIIAITVNNFKSVPIGESVFLYNL